jgi:hypothetical protein
MFPIRRGIDPVRVDERGRSGRTDWAVPKVPAQRERLWLAGVGQPAGPSKGTRHGTVLKESVEKAARRVTTTSFRKLTFGGPTD